MLRRGRVAEAEVAGQAEGWQEEDAAVRQGRDPAGGVYIGVEDGWVRIRTNDDLTMGCIEMALLHNSVRKGFTT